MAKSALRTFSESFLRTMILEMENELNERRSRLRRFLVLEVTRVPFTLLYIFERAKLRCCRTGKIWFCYSPSLDVPSLVGQMVDIDGDFNEETRVVQVVDSVKKSSRAITPLSSLSHQSRIKLTTSQTSAALDLLSQGYLSTPQ